jgi:superfamily II DNA/RNA helicase
MNKIEDVRHFVAQAIGKKLLPLQEKTIKAVEKSNKIQLYAPTGSGKTIAFWCALLEAKKRYSWNKVLVIVPTRELAVQIGEVFAQLKTGMKSIVCYGGHSFKSELNSIQAEPEVIIGTPGRIADHIRRESFYPKEMNALIIDEVDKVLELGFKKEVNAIKEAIGKLNFYMEVSATMQNTLGDEELVRVEGEKQTAPQITYYALQVTEESHKAETVLNVLNQLPPASTFVFLNHREAVDRIADYLSHKGLPVTIYHGGLDQIERERNLIRFRNGTAPIMVVTDLAARGLDVADVQYIFHYQFPNDEPSFIHRNGRTARMGATGAVFVVQDEKDLTQISYLKGLSVKKYKPSNQLTDWNTNKVTLSFSAGKKDKVNKIDLLGFLTKECHIPATEIGKIDTYDHFSYVAISEDYLDAVINRKTKPKIKKSTVKIRVY